MMANWERSESFASWNGCRNCGHFRGNRCVAYPNGIPFLIASGQVDHLVTRPGQVGDTVFAPFDLEVFKATGQRVPIESPEPVRPGS